MKVKPPNTSQIDALARAIDLVGSATELARFLGVTKAAVSQWRLEGRRVPAEHCPSIERLTHGIVRCESLRPDVDWAAVRMKRAPRKDVVVAVP